MIGLLSVVLSNQHVSLGVWGQSEPVLVTVHVGAALGLAAFAGAVAQDGAIAALARSPLTATAVLLAVWSLVTAPFAEFPWTSVLGAPQSGEGALWPIDLVGYLLAARLLLRRAPPLFDALAGLSAVLTVGVGVWNLAIRFPDWGPLADLRAFGLFFGFAMFLGYSALALLPLAWSWRARGRRGWRLMALAGIAGVVLSSNRSAMAGLVVFGATLILQRWLPRTASLSRPAVVVVTALVAVALLAPYGLIRHVDWLHGVTSLSDRAILFAAVDTQLFESLRAIILGQGWGHYQEHLVRNIASTGISLFDNRWSELARDLFHSHNAALETVFSVGLPGLALAVVLRAGAVLEAPPAARGTALAFVLAWSLTDAAWFMLGPSMAPLAMALAALTVTADPPPSQDRRMRWPMAATTAGGAVALGLAAAVLVSAALQFQRLKLCLPPHPWTIACADVDLPHDPRGSDLGLAYLLGNAMATIPPGTAPYKVMPPDQVSLLRRLRVEARRRAAAGASTSLAIEVINSRAQIGLVVANKPLTDRAEREWREEILILLERAPGRMDVAATYFYRLLQGGGENRAELALQAMERIDSAHPVVLWFRGLLLLNHPDPARQAAGLAGMRRALDRGVARLMPIAPEWIEPLRQAQ